MTVILQYFKPSGKWYETAAYETKQTDLYKIWEEVEAMEIHPGLRNRWSTGFVSVDVPEHKHRHPHLVVMKGQVD
jgi:hypothetical protein